MGGVMASQVLDMFEELALDTAGRKLKAQNQKSASGPAPSTQTGSFLFLLPVTISRGLNLWLSVDVLPAGSVQGGGQGVRPLCTYRV